MKYTKMERPSYSKKVERDYKKAHNRLGEKEAFLYILEQNPDCTIWEIGRPMLRVLGKEIGMTSLSHNDFAVREVVTHRKQQINHDPRFPEHVIAAPHMLTTDKGEKLKISCLEIAKKGKKSTMDTANKCDMYIAGYTKCKENLHEIYNDPQIAADILARKKRREIIVGN